MVCILVSCDSNVYSIHVIILLFCLTYHIVLIGIQAIFQVGRNKIF